MDRPETGGAAPGNNPPPLLFFFCAARRTGRWAAAGAPTHILAPPQHTYLSLFRSRRGKEKGARLLFCENPATRLTARRWRRPSTTIRHHTIPPHTPAVARTLILEDLFDQPLDKARRAIDPLPNRPCAQRAAVLTVLLPGAIQELYERMNRKPHSRYARWATNQNKPGRARRVGPQPFWSLTTPKRSATCSAQSSNTTGMKWYWRLMARALSRPTTSTEASSIWSSSMWRCPA